MLNVTKKIDNLYEEIYDYENIHNAYKKARKNKRFRACTLEFTNNLEENLIEIQNELIWKTYEVGKYKQFYIHEPKKRLIMALPFRDRVVQWAVYSVLYPMYDKRFIDDSYGCRKEKGMHKAVQRTQYWLKDIERKNIMQKESWYYLKLDISKFFYRVVHDIIEEIIRTCIKDERLIWLIMKIVRSESTPFGLPAGISPGECAISEMLFNRGMPVGNLLSQLIANIYMDVVDQFAKHKLKCKHYIRYMDDIIILHKDKNQLQRWKIEIEYFIKEKLGLDLNKKTCIRPLSQGVDFVGCKIWHSHVKLRKNTALRIRRQWRGVEKKYTNGQVTKEYYNSVKQSFLGLLKHIDCHSLTTAIFK